MKWIPLALLLAANPEPASLSAAERPEPSTQSTSTIIWGQKKLTIITVITPQDMPNAPVAKTSHRRRNPVPKPKSPPTVATKPEFY